MATTDMNDDVKAAALKHTMARIREALPSAGPTMALQTWEFDVLLAHIDGEQARQDAAVAAARKECLGERPPSGLVRERALADRIAELEHLSAGRLLVLNEKADEATREWARAEKAEAERDALRDRPPTREELEYTRAMAILKQRHEDSLGDDLSDHVYRLMAQVEAARAALHGPAGCQCGNIDAADVLAAMDEVAK